MSGKGSIITCRNCGESLESGWERCPVCLTPTSSARLTCPGCQAAIKENWKLCPHCKTTLPGWKTPPIEEKSDSDKNQIFVTIVDNQPVAAVGFGIDLPLSKGEVLGERYRIIQPLGAGGFGAVYQVDDLVLNEQIALKVVVTGEGKAQHAAEQILHEFRLRAKINDTTHIVKAQDPRSCEYKGLSLVLLPMEFADGKSLRQWMTQNQDIKQRQKTGLQLFRQACQGVKAIHDAGLVHLDIKPENILLVDGKAKIADFGIGRYGACQFAKNPGQLLHQGIGTPQYMSPEQFQVARQKDIGPASDIYSLGIVLFEILDGNLPFDGSPIELRDKHLNMQPVHLMGNLEKWSRIVDRCLVKEPQERYPDISRLISDLDRAAQGTALSIDVSCSKCGHINANPDLKVCGSCRANLESLFRSCPVCARLVRLDVNTCPGCGKAVAAYYLLLDRKEQIERLKDEDPVETIEILEMVLRDGADDYQEHAIKLIRDLRQKQSQAGPLIASAIEASKSGIPEQAIKAWQKVLEIIPRHRIAAQQIQKLDALLKDVQERLEKTSRLMNEGQFQETDMILQGCLKDIPARQEIRKMLDACRSRAKRYGDAFDQASTAMRDKRFQEADVQIKVALSQAAQSLEAKSLSSQICGTWAKSLIDQAQPEILAAKFEEAQALLDQAEQVWHATDKLDKARELLTNSWSAYDEYIEHALYAKAYMDFEKALKEVKASLEICPNSEEAQKLKRDIEVLWEEKKKNREQFRKDFISSVQWLIVIITGIAGIGMLLYSQPNPTTLYATPITRNCIFEKNVDSM